jgi:hypothetical protein
MGSLLSSSSWQVLLVVMSSVVVPLVGASTSSASILAQWTFENSLPAATNSMSIGPIVPETGSGAASAFHTSAATDYSNPVGNGSAESFSSNTWTTIGDYYQFQTSSLGFENIVVSWDQTRSGTGPSSFFFQYSLDGLTFTDFPVGTYSVPEVDWSSSTASASSSFIRDLSLVVSLANDASIFFRLSSSAVAAAGGTNRVDNFTINGTAILQAAVPEASAFLVWSLLCGSALVGAKRRRDLE